MNFWKFCLVAIIASLCSGISPAAIVQSAEHQKVAYFLASVPTRIERYQMDSRQWQAAIPLSSARGTPTAITVDADGIYVAYILSVYRYKLDGSAETHVFNADYPVKALHTDGNLLFVNFTAYGYSRLASINKTTNTLISRNEAYSSSIFGSSIAPGINKIIGLVTDRSPSSTISISYTDSGEFTTTESYRHDSDQAMASRTWLFPNQGRLVDNAGMVYSAGDMSLVATFPTEIDDIIFNGMDIPIIAQGNQLLGYNAGLQEVGRKSLAKAPYKIFVNGSDVLIFSLDSSISRGLSVTTTPLTEINANHSNQAPDPATLSYLPETSFIGNDGLIYLVSNGHQTIFRWNPITQTYATNIPLSAIPRFVTYAPALNRIYVTYPNGEIRRIELSAPDLAELPYHTLPAAPLGVSSAGTYLFIRDHNGYGNHLTINQSGILVDRKNKSYSYSSQYTWSDATQKMYFFRDGLSPNDLIWEQINANGSAYPGIVAGGIGAMQDSPLHTSTGILPPIRVSPDGARVILGSGRAHDATTLAVAPHSLSNSIKDADWMTPTDLRSIRNLNTKTQFQQWSGLDYTAGLTKEYPGTAHRILSLSPTRVLGVAMLANGQPSFYLLDQNFDLVPATTLAPPSRLISGTVTTTSVSLQWADVSGETSYRIERRILPNGSWTAIGTSEISTPTFEDPTPPAGSYSYRVIALNSDGESGPSNATTVSISPPSQPQGLTARFLSRTRAQIDWLPVANATGYEVQQASNPAGPWLTTASNISPLITTIEQSVALIASPLYFRIRANGTFGYSPYSTTASATPPPQAVPATPVLNAPTATYGRISLTWTDVAWEDGYWLEKRAVGETYWETYSVGRDVVSYEDEETNAWIDDQLTSGVSFQYRVRATNSAGSSSYSNIQTMQAIVLPPPSQVTIGAESPYKVTVSWNVVPDALSYTLEISNDGTYWSTETTVSRGQPLTVSINYLSPSTTYRYRVRASNSGGASLPSAVVTITTPTLMAHWRFVNFGTTSNTGAAANLAKGPDGIPNLLKYASNLNASEKVTYAEFQSKGLPRVEANTSRDRLQVSFLRRKATSDPGISYSVEFSSNLVQWAAEGSAATVRWVDDVWELVIWEDSVKLSESPRRYARVKVTEIP
jgi:hypothetical protein